jgi:hypothetical protein
MNGLSEAGAGVGLPQGQNNMNGMMQMLMAMMGMMQGGRGENMQRLLDHLSKPPPSQMPQAVYGEQRGQGLGNPETTGLNAFYSNNPQMRPGEFDPFGSKANSRRNTDRWRADQMQSQNWQTQFYNGLADLNTARRKARQTYSTDQVNPNQNS